MRRSAGLGSRCYWSAPPTSVRTLSPHTEFPALVRAAEERHTVLTWVLLSEATYQSTPVAQLQAAHDLGQPLDTLETEVLEGALS